MKIPDQATAQEPRVEMLPLIDVVFLVLVAFIYASMFLTQNSGLPVSLPEASQTELQLQDLITLTITQEGSLYIDQQSLSLKNLVEALRAARIARPDAVLLVKADRRAGVGRLVQVMDTARLAGITALTIKADSKPNTISE